MNLLEIRDLATRFTVEGRAIEAVRGVSFTIDEGETVALVGESGSGKSVTALSVLQLLPYPMASHPSGSVRYRGTELIGASDVALRKVRGNRISMIFQEPMTSLNPLHTIEKQISEALLLHKGLSKSAARKRTLELLDLVGLSGLKGRLGDYPHTLSGGQRQRVMIAMALANEPDLLIADEPTTALDVTVQAQVLKLLKELQAKLGMAILLITHDLNIVRRFADRVCVMTDGLIVEQGPVEEVYTRPQHAYTRHLLESEPRGRPEPAPPGGRPLVETDDLKVWFPVKGGVFSRVKDHIKAVDGISLEVRPRHTVGVVGESGSGKTTLGLAILRLISSEGPILYQGRPLQDLGFKELRPLRRELQVVFQDPYGSLSPRMSIKDIVGEGLKVHDMGGSERERRDLVAGALEEVGLEAAMMDRYPHEFSGGQRQRIAIARAMVLRPRFVVLDEPTSALDMSVQAQIVDLLRKLQIDHDLAYLFISHDLRVIRAMSHEVVVMKDGVVVERGSADTIFDAPETAYTKALMAAAFNLEAIESDAVRM
ncbi:MAG: ABC transporter ATP-binding protein [Proteobacteria bacterium]|jgi:microcin C transport system ATP-binding protein|nr:ABC transporter ATP-binding protein [Pseudomonadota bacterium]MDA1072926.1 ABC transporter ATP-binding protein [Pseudomonadota bacterium]